MLRAFATILSCPNAFPSTVSSTTCVPENSSRSKAPKPQVPPDNNGPEPTASNARPRANQVRPMHHLRMRRFISPVGNLLDSFFVTKRFTSGIKLVHGRAIRRHNHEFQASGSHYRLQHRLRQAEIGRACV